MYPMFSQNIQISLLWPLCCCSLVRQGAGLNDGRGWAWKGLRVWSGNDGEGRKLGRKESATQAGKRKSKLGGRI